MAITLKMLSAGNWTGSGTAGDRYLYPNPPGGGSIANTTALVKSITLTNKDTAAVTVDLKVRAAGSSTLFKVAPSISIAPNTTVVLDNEIALNVSASTGVCDAVALTVPSAFNIDFVLTGLTRDI